MFASPLLACATHVLWCGKVGLFLIRSARPARRGPSSARRTSLGLPLAVMRQDALRQAQLTEKGDTHTSPSLESRQALSC